MASDSPWIAVGDLGSAFEKDVNVLPPSRDLAERCFDLHYEDGSIEQFAFETEDRLIRSDLGKKKAPEIYRATSLQPNRYFVDFISQTDRVTTVSMFLDLEQKSFTSVTGRLPSKAEAAMSLLERSRRGRDLTGVTADFSHGAIDEPVTDATPRHRVTTNSVGHRIEYTYSPSERYEHIYVNDFSIHGIAWRAQRRASRTPIGATTTGLAKTYICSSGERKLCRPLASSC